MSSVYTAAGFLLGVGLVKVSVIEQAWGFAIFGGFVLIFWGSVQEYCAKHG